MELTTDSSLDSTVKIGEKYQIDLEYHNSHILITSNLGTGGSMYVHIEDLKQLKDAFNLMIKEYNLGESEEDELEEL